MNKLLSVAIAGFLAFLPTASLAGGEAKPQPAAQKRMNDNDTRNLHGLVWFGWQKREFAELETVAAEMRETGNKTEEGYDQLVQFYNGFLNGFTQRSDYDIIQITWTQAFAEWKSKYPESPTPHIANAKLLVTQAWYVRGDGYAPKVWKEDWAEFARLLKEARDGLEANTAVASKDPMYYVLMGRIALGLGEDWESTFARQQEGHAKFPKFTALYFQGADYLLPQWYGSDDAFMQYAAWSATQTRGMSGMALYAQIFWNHSDVEQRLFEQNAAHRERMRQGARDWLQYYPTPQVARNMRYYACRLRDEKLLNQTTAVFRELTDGDNPWEGKSFAQQCK